MPKEYTYFNSCVVDINAMDRYVHVTYPTMILDTKHKKTKKQIYWYKINSPRLILDVQT